MDERPNCHQILSTNECSLSFCELEKSSEFEIFANKRIDVEYIENNFCNYFIHSKISEKCDHYRISIKYENIEEIINQDINKHFEFINSIYPLNPIICSLLVTIFKHISLMGIISILLSIGFYVNNYFGTNAYSFYNKSFSNFAIECALDAIKFSNILFILIILSQSIRNIFNNIFRIEIMLLFSKFAFGMIISYFSIFGTTLYAFRVLGLFMGIIINSIFIYSMIVLIIMNMSKLFDIIIIILKRSTQFDRIRIISIISTYVLVMTCYFNSYGITLESIQSLTIVFYLCLIILKNIEYNLILYFIINFTLLLGLICYFGKIGSTYWVIKIQNLLLGFVTVIIFNIYFIILIIILIQNSLKNNHWILIIKENFPCPLDIMFPITVIAGSLAALRVMYLTFILDADLISNIFIILLIIVLKLNQKHQSWIKNIIINYTISIGLCGHFAIIAVKDVSILIVIAIYVLAACFIINEIYTKQVISQTTTIILEKTKQKFYKLPKYLRKNKIILENMINNFILEIVFIVLDLRPEKFDILKKNISRFRFK